MRLNLAASVLLVSLLVACSPSSPPDAGQGATKPPPRAGQPLNSVELAARIAKVRAAAVLGDDEAVRREMDAMQEDYRRSIKLADAGRPIDPEAARSAAKRVPGVHSVVWIDRSNLLALVDRNEQRSMATVDAICSELEALGDTLAVVVHLQSRVARSADELETINRNCQLTEGDRALFQTRRELDVVPKDIRAQHAAQKSIGADVRGSREKADEAARLIEASTPEM
jgi:hypothetical protein